jgi:hypothetical protein
VFNISSDEGGEYLFFLVMNILGKDIEDSSASYPLNEASLYS